MTFEEFFAKKKIDLPQLEKAEPALYTEFKSHFAAMGEKSFDHTKKFWFNKLRRLYHLTPLEKAITQIETAIASQAEPLSSPTIEQKPFTPRFKSANISKTEPETEQPETKPVAKPAFRPRSIPSKEPEQSIEQTAKGQESTPPVEKPGFKPRNIQPPAEENAADSNRADSRPGQPEISETPISNPAKQEEAIKESYKPKFKLKNIPRNPAAGEEQTGHPIKPELVPEAQPDMQSDSPAQSDIERKISSSTEDKTPEQEIQDNDLDLRGSDDTSPEEKPKSAYKPKFNLKNIKPKYGDDNKNL